MKTENLGIKITVEYYCENIIEPENLKEAFHNDINAAWRFMSDNHKKHPLEFTSQWKIVKVEPMCQKRK